MTDFQFYNQEPRLQYFMKPRDEVKTRAPKALVGKLVWAKRYIVRVGYKFAPEYVKPDAVEKECRDMLDQFLSRFDVDLSGLGDFRQKEFYAQFFKTFPAPKYKAIGRIIRRSRIAEGREADWRRFWFVDTESFYPHDKRVLYEIFDTQRVVTGEWFPGGEDESSGLNPAIHHTVFCAHPYQNLKGGWAQRSDAVMLHPDDVTPANPDRV